MKKIVFATLLACSTAANAQFSMDLPSLWWPEEFTQQNKSNATDVELVLASQNVNDYLKINSLGPILDVVKSDGKMFVVVEGGSFEVVIRKNSNPAVRPVKGTLFID